MNLWIRCFASLLLVVLSASCVAADDIRIKKQPVSSLHENQEVVYDKWWVSGALRDDKEPSILGTAYQSQSEAVAYAQRWLESNHKVSKPSDWTYLKFVEIEGEYSIKEKNKKEETANSNQLDKNNRVGGDSMGKGAFFDPSVQFGSPEDKLFTAAIDRAGNSIWKDIKGAVKKRQSDVTDSFRRAKAGMEFMNKDVRKLEAEQFRKVNGLVKDYNRTLMNYSTSGPGAELFSRIKPMEPFSDEMIRQALAREKLASTSSAPMPGDATKPLTDKQSQEEDTKIYFAEVKTFYRDGRPVKQEDDGWFRHGFGYDRERRQDLPGTLQQARDFLTRYKQGEFVVNNPELHQFRIVDKDGRVIE